MTRTEMVEWLKNEVTMSGSINITLTDAEYERMLDKETQMLYEKYPNAIQKKFFIIPKAAFYTPEFRKNRIIQFPKCVKSVTKLIEMKRRNVFFGTTDPDFGFNRTFMADMWVGGQMNLDSVMFRTFQYSIMDQLKAFTLVDIRHSWSRLNQQLLIQGHDPYYDVYCELYVGVDEQELWEDPWAKLWLAAKAKLQVAKMIGTFTANLLGQTTVNTNLYTEEANNDITACNEAWKDMLQADWFETDH